MAEVASGLMGSIEDYKRPLTILSFGIYAGIFALVMLIISHNPVHFSVSANPNAAASGDITTYASLQIALFPAGILCLGFVLLANLRLLR